jgi:hypothetical protein
MDKEQRKSWEFKHLKNEYEKMVANMFIKYKVKRSSWCLYIKNKCISFFCSNTLLTAKQCRKITLVKRQDWYTVSYSK